MAKMTFGIPSQYNHNVYFKCNDNIPVYISRIEEINSNIKALNCHREESTPTSGWLKAGRSFCVLTLKAEG